MSNTPIAKTPIDSDLVRSLAQLLDDTNLTEIEYDTGTLRIRVARQGVPMSHLYAAPMPATAAPVSQPASVSHDDAANHPGVVTSPMVGVAYLSSDPTAPKFVEVGQTVSAGQTLMLIEAMKTFNTISAPRGGKVTRILVTDSQPVEFGEPLIIVE